MSAPPKTHPPTPPAPDAAWLSLVSRSVSAWSHLSTFGPPRTQNLARSTLQSCPSLDTFLSPNFSPLMFWFFQRRDVFLSQPRLKKWSRDYLEDYILLPAFPGFVLRSHCFFLSHFWHSPKHPDPDGTYLRLQQAELGPQEWQFIWVDWTCAPQAPRSGPGENAYFERCLRTMSGIIRNCGFMWYYPLGFEPRLWILYEVAEFVLTSEGGGWATDDIAPFLQHVDEMVEEGVQKTLEKHRYRCSYERDRQHLTSWLELLVLLRKLRFDVDFVRSVMDHVTWFRVSNSQYYAGGMELNRHEGYLVAFGKTHRFTPFPRYEDGKVSKGGA